MAPVEEVFNLLSTSNRKDRKLRLDQAIDSLKSLSVRRVLYHQTQQKWSNPALSIFTWKSVGEVVLYILRDELAQTTKIRRGAKLNSQSPELAGCWKLLAIFVSFGLKGDLQISTTELTELLADTLNDESFAFSHRNVVECLSILFRSSLTNNPSPDIPTYSRLTVWCLHELSRFPSVAVGRLLCQSLACSCFFTHEDVYARVLPKLDDLLSQCGNGSPAMAWIMRLLRWLCAAVCTSRCDQLPVISTFLHRVASILKHSVCFREHGLNRSIMALNSSITDPSFLCSNEFIIKVVSFSNDPFAMDNLFISSPIFQRLFKASKIRQHYEGCILSAGLINNSLVYNRSVHPIALDVLQNSELFHSNACYLVEDPPNIFLKSKLDSNLLEMNDASNTNEVLSFCRWILNVLRQDLSSPTGAVTLVDFGLDVTALIRVSVDFCVRAFRQSVDRMRFQAEETFFIYLSQMWDLFGTCAATILLAKSDNLANGDELLEPFSHIFGPVPSATSHAGHSSVSVNPGDFVASLITANEAFGWLFWPVFDWLMRLQWQFTTGCPSSPPFDVPRALHSLSLALPIPKRQSSTECCLSAIRTTLEVIVDAAQQSNINLASLQLASYLKNIWNQCLDLFELLSLTNKQEFNITSELGTTNGVKRALSQDRLICSVLIRLLEIEKPLTCSSKVPEFLPRLWTLLFAMPSYLNDSLSPLCNLIPWRFRLAVRAFQLWPRDSMLLVIGSKQQNPCWNSFQDCCPPLRLLFACAPVGNSVPMAHVLQEATLRWSLPRLFPQENSPDCYLCPNFGRQQLKLMQESILHCVCKTTLPDQRLQLVNEILLLDLRLNCLENVDLVDEATFSNVLGELVNVIHSENLGSLMASKLLCILPRIPATSWPDDTILKTLINTLISPCKDFQHSLMELTTPSSQNLASLDLFEMNDDSAVASFEASKFLLFDEDSKQNDAPTSNKIASLDFSFLNSSCPRFVSIFHDCVRELLGQRSWRLSEDTKWFTALSYSIASGLQSSIECARFERDGEHVSLFCCLLDVFRDAIKCQLLLKRWELFICLVESLITLVEALAYVYTGIRSHGSPLWRQMSCQIVRLLETSWIAGGSKWPGFDEANNAPPRLITVFCASIRVWLQLHSLELLEDNFIRFPLSVFLNQRSPQTSLQMKIMIHGIIERLSNKWITVSLPSLLIFASSLLDATSSLLPSSSIDGAVDNRQFIRILTIDQLLRLLVLSSGDVTAEFLTDCGTKDMDKITLAPYALLSTIVKVVKYLIYECLTSNSTIIENVVKEILTSRLSRGSSVCRYLLALVLVSFSDGDVANAAMKRLVDLACRIWGYSGFHDYFLENKSTFNAVNVLSGSSIENRADDEVDSMFIASCLLTGDSLLSTLTNYYYQSTSRLLSNPEDLVDVAVHLSTLACLFMEGGGEMIVNCIVFRLLTALAIFKSTSSEFVNHSQDLRQCRGPLSNVLALCEKRVRLPPEYLLELVEGMLEAAGRFLQNSPGPMASENCFDPVGGRWHRLCVWTALARFVAHLVFSAVIVVCTDVTELRRLQSYVAWRLVLCANHLIDLELSSDSLQKSVFLLDFLVDVVELSNGFRHEPAVYCQLETDWHNATTYLMVHAFSKSCKIVDSSRVQVSVLRVLDKLLCKKSFASAICCLDDFPADLPQLLKYQTVLSEVCACDRTSVLQEVDRLLASLSFSAIIRCPRLLLYRSHAINHLIDLINSLSSDISTQIESWTKDHQSVDRWNCPLVAQWTDQLHHRLVSEPHRQADLRAELAADACFQNWVPSALKSTRCPGEQLVSLKLRLRAILSKKNRSFDDCFLHSRYTMDPQTEQSFVKCLSLLSNGDEAVYNYPQSFALSQLPFKPSNPWLLVQFSTLLYIVKEANCPRSAAACEASTCLRSALSNGTILSSMLLDGFNLQNVNTELSFSTLLAPYMDIGETILPLRGQGRSKEVALSRLVNKSLSPKALSVLSDDLLLSIFRDFLFLSISKSDFIKWIFDNELVFDDLISNLRSLLEFENNLQQVLIPWNFALLFIHLKISGEPRGSKINSLPLENLTKFFNKLLKEGTDLDENIFQHRFLISILVSVHCLTQWLIQSRITSSISWGFDWTAAALFSLHCGCSDEAELFFELSWIHEPEALFADNGSQCLWIELCRTKGDLMGLRSAQIFFNSLDHSSRIDTLASFNKLVRFAIHDTARDSQWLLNWYDGKMLHNRASGSFSSPVEPQIALCLHRLGADNVFRYLVQEFSEFKSIELEEARHRIAWRMGTWQIPFHCNAGQSREELSNISLLPVAFRNASESSSDSSNIERFLFLSQHYVSLADWEQLSELVEEKWQLLSAFDFDYQTVSKLNVLSNWRRVSHLLASGIDSAPLASLLLIDTVASSLKCHPNESTASLLEASLCLSFASTDHYKNDNIITNLQCLCTAALLSLADVVCRSNGDRLFTERLLQSASRELNNLPGSLLDTPIMIRLQLQSAFITSKLDFMSGDVSLAINQLDSALKNVASVLQSLGREGEDLQTRLLRECFLSATVCLCQWLASSKTKSWADLIVKHLKPALDRAEIFSISSKCKPLQPGIAKKIPNPASLQSTADALATLADFSDAQFKSFDAYLKSSEFAVRRDLLATADVDAACLTEVDKKSRFLRLLQRQSTLESVEMANLVSGLQSSFSSALLSYCRCLAISERHNLKVYRLVSLWLGASTHIYLNDIENRDKATTGLFSPSWLAEFDHHIMAIRPDKFLPLFPQLLVRMTSSNTPDIEKASRAEKAFLGTLQELVKRIMAGHPHHTGFQLLSLVNADRDSEYESSETSKSRPTFPHAPKSKRQKVEQPTFDINGRKNVASDLFDELCRSERGIIFLQMSQLAEAYIELANIDVEKQRGQTGDLPLPLNCAFSRLLRHCDESLGLIAVPTCPPKVEMLGIYPDERLVSPVGFDPTFRLAGGLNLPKIITCLCSDGRKRRQLVKGKDDPRQDAIMQQVFSAANHLLASFSVDLLSTTDIPKLDQTFLKGFTSSMRIRTYLVIPLARRSGLIEWCEGTVPLGEWLASETGGAHQRYRPTDITPTQAKLRLAAVRERGLERRFSVFQEICTKIQPVLGYFFLENFSTPATWQEAKMRYTASLAVSSILGFLVGLGDRHPHNLLLHPTTGEIVHIDLGIAFDQGRLLPTPELVPFRLTRDLVHALGPLGLESGFTVASEAAFRAFSSGSDVIITLLEVLLHDPLYSWSLTPAQLCALEAKRAEVNTIAQDVTQCSRRRPLLTIGCGEASILSTLRHENQAFRAGGTACKLKDFTNQLAERVLLTVRDKLGGHVGGIGSGGLSTAAGSEGIGTLNTSGQINLLIRAATNPENLSRMYFGWQAYL